MKVKNLNSHIEHIVNGYKQQNLLYQKLLHETKSLAEHISNVDTVAIIDTVAAREQLILSIKELDENINGHRQAVMELVHLKDFNLDRVGELVHPALRQEYDEQCGQIKALLSELVQLDKLNQERLQANIKDAKSEFRKINQHHEIQQVYLDRPERYPEARFLDKLK